MPIPPADWQLPPGVSRGLWDYLHDPEIAQLYDQRLTGTSLLTADQAFAEKHFPRPGRLADLGCGTGRLAVAFARRGYWVLAVDLSAPMLQVVGARAREGQCALHRLQANLVELGGIADQSFDYAACLFSTLGMIVGEEPRRRAIGHVFRLLRPGGRFVLHVHNRWFSLWDSPGRRWLMGDLLRSLLGREGQGDRPMPVHQGVAGLTLHHFTRREAVGLLREAGFRMLTIQPVGLGPDGRLSWPGWFTGLRAYGYLLAAERPMDRLRP